jgi:sugar (pentulose or hexulose) kinase
LTLLGVDIGTTHVKACAYGEDGRLLGASRQVTPTTRNRGGGAEDYLGRCTSLARAD